MTRPRSLHLTPGRTYRTADLALWSANPTRLAGRLVREGRLTRLRHGLFRAPREGKWGPTAPSEEELLRALLGSGEFVFTGPEFWNALGLGATAVSPEKLVYNSKRTGVFDLDGRRFRLRRVAWPRRVTREWYAVDLLENHALSGASLEELEAGLVRALRESRLSAKRLTQAAEIYATQRTRNLVERAVVRARPRK
jgi:hypothetical protein